MSDTNAPQTDIWIKWDWLWKAIFYSSIIFSCLLLAFDDVPLNDKFLPFALSGLFVLWHWGGLRLAYRQGQDWDERPYLRFFIILGDIVFWFLLVMISPAYYFVLFGMFSQIFRQPILTFPLILL